MSRVERFGMHRDGLSRRGQSYSGLLMLNQGKIKRFALQAARA